MYVDRKPFPWTEPWAIFLLFQLIPCILVSENRVASQAVVGGMVMSKRVSNSCCYYGAAAQSKSPSVGHLEWEQKQVETTQLPSQLNFVHHGYRVEAFSYSQAPSIILLHMFFSIRCLYFLLFSIKYSWDKFVFTLRKKNKFNTNKLKSS